LTRRFYLAMPKKHFSFCSLVARPAGADSTCFAAGAGIPSATMMKSLFILLLFAAGAALATPVRFYLGTYTN